MDDFREDCLWASAQPTCIDPTVNFQLMATLHHTDCACTLELAVCSSRTFSLLYKVGRSVLIIIQEDPDRIVFFIYSYSFSLFSKVKNKKHQSPTEGLEDYSRRKKKKKTKGCVRHCNGTTIPQVSLYQVKRNTFSIQWRKRWIWCEGWPRREEPSDD